MTVVKKSVSEIKKSVKQLNFVKMKKKTIKNVGMGLFVALMAAGASAFTNQEVAETNLAMRYWGHNGSGVYKEIIGTPNSTCQLVGSLTCIYQSEDPNAPEEFNETEIDDLGLDVIPFSSATGIYPGL